MGEVGNRIKKMRLDRDMTQKELANRLGLNGETAIANYENGRSIPKDDIKYKICDIFNCTMDYLMGKEDYKKAINREQTHSEVISVNVYGTIPAGIPLEMIEDVIGIEELPKSASKGDKKFFALKIKGSSMEPEYRNNDIVIFEKVDDCENEEDCVVMVNGNEGTFKKVIKDKNGITLKPLNPEFNPIKFSNEQIKNLPIRILGRFYELRRRKR